MLVSLRAVPEKDAHTSKKCVRDNVAAVMKGFGQDPDSKNVSGNIPLEKTTSGACTGDNGSSGNLDIG